MSEQTMAVDNSSAAPRQPTFGIVGVFDSPASIFHACEALRDAGYRSFDAHTPFPVHGLERAMALPPSRMPWIVLTGGISGLVGAFLLQWWTQVVDYPLNISGKPSFAYQAWVPVTFELTVLLSGLSCFFGLWALNKLPTFFHPVMQHRSFARVTDDRFLVSIEATDPKFDLVRTRELLASVGAQEIEEVQS